MGIIGECTQADARASAGDPLLLSDFQSLIREAEGYLELGMTGEAWEATGNLDPLDRCEPLAVEMRLRIATAGEKWELGEALVTLNRHRRKSVDVAGLVLIIVLTSPFLTP